MCAILNGFRLMFYIQIGYLKTIYIFYDVIGVRYVVVTVYHYLNVCCYGVPMLKKTPRSELI